MVAGAGTRSWDVLTATIVVALILFLWFLGAAFVALLQFIVWWGQNQPLNRG